MSAAPMIQGGVGIVHHHYSVVPPPMVVMVPCPCPHFVIIICPHTVIHPVSSCLQQWGQVLGHPLLAAKGGAPVVIISST